MSFLSTRTYRLMLAAVVAGVIAPASALAAVVPVDTTHQRAATPVVQRQIRTSMSAPGRTWQPRRLGPHVFYGTITAISGTTLTMHLRNGHILAVDAGTAISNGNYSAPLFVGKLVSVDGDEAGGKFTAEHIFRLTNLGSLRADK